MIEAPSLPRPTPDDRSIIGRTIDLERLDLDRHGHGLWQAIGEDRRIWSGIPVGPFEEEQSFTAWLSDRAQLPNAALYAIIDKRGDRRRIAGLFLLLQINPAMATVEIGLVYGAALTRRIGGTEAFFLIARHIFEALEYRRLEWRCNTRNEASRRAATRFGFTLEGVLRQTMWIKGANCDTAVYSMLDREWPAIGERLGAWLAPENFSADGCQIRRLSEFN